MCLAWSAHTSAKFLLRQAMAILNEVLMAPWTKLLPAMLQGQPYLKRSCQAAQSVRSRCRTCSLTFTDPPTGHSFVSSQRPELRMPCRPCVSASRDVLQRYARWKKTCKEARKAKAAEVKARIRGF